jgi:putative ABC transport system substrate-binding protein
LAAELVELRARVIVAGGREVGALAAKAATSTIPILINMSSDPIKYGLVVSFNRPETPPETVHHQGPTPRGFSF